MSIAAPVGARRGCQLDHSQTIVRWIMICVCIHHRLFQPKAATLFLVGRNVWFRFDTLPMRRVPTGNPFDDRCFDSLNLTSESE